MKLYAQDVRRSAGAFAVLAAAAGLALTGCHSSSEAASPAATPTSGTASAPSSASSAASSASSTPSSVSSAPAVVSSGSLPFPTTVGDTWAYSNSPGGTTSKNEITSSTQVAAGQLVAMTSAFTDNGTTTHSTYDYIVQPNGQISLPTSQFTSSMSSSGASVKILSGGIYWPTAAEVSGGQPVHSTLVMEITIAGKVEKITEHITSTGEGTATVTVPAGTYSASVVNVVESADFMGFNTTIDDKSWLAPGVGPVQSELLTGTGGNAKLTNKEVLTSFTKG
jgi:hypothetical protein